MKRASASGFMFVGSLLTAITVSCSSTSTGGVEANFVAEGISGGLENNLGYAVTLQKASIATFALELGRCATAIRFFSTGIALAHSEGSPNRLGTPAALSLLSFERQEIGSLAPPANRYCSLSIDYGPADADALGLSSDVGMTGKTLHLEGSAERGGQTFPFVADSALSTQVRAAATIDLSTRDAKASVVLSWDRTHWFDDVDFAAIPPDELGRVLLANISASTRVRVE